MGLCEIQSLSLPYADNSIVAPNFQLDETIFLVTIGCRPSQIVSGGVNPSIPMPGYRMSIPRLSRQIWIARQILGYRM